MNKRWIITAIIISIIIGIFGVMQAKAQTVSEKQNARKARMKTFQPNINVTTITKGYISPPVSTVAIPYTVPQSRYINLKTRQTSTGSVTTGYINGQYIRVVEKRKN